MPAIEKVKEYGAEVEKGLARCGNNEALYWRLVNMMIDELASGALGEALKKGDLDKAFDIAHKLKGGVNNLALTPISGPLGELTDLLRNKRPGDYDGRYAEIVLKTNELAELMK